MTVYVRSTTLACLSHRTSSLCTQREEERRAVHLWQLALVKCVFRRVVQHLIARRVVPLWIEAGRLVSSDCSRMSAVFAASRCSRYQWESRSVADSGIGGSLSFVCPSSPVIPLREAAP